MTTVQWENAEDNSLENCTLSSTDSGYKLEGSITLNLDGAAGSVTYKVECDQNWLTRNVLIRQEYAGKFEELTLQVSDDQTWHANGEKVEFATSIYDIDLEISPSTNMIPLKRLNMQVGEKQTVDAVWIRFPSLRLEHLQQEYTRLGENIYDYRVPASDFHAQLAVDEDGLVIDYPPFWKRMR